MEPTAAWLDSACPLSLSVSLTAHRKGGTRSGCCPCEGCAASHTRQSPAITIIITKHGRGSEYWGTASQHECLMLARIQSQVHLVRGWQNRRMRNRRAGSNLLLSRARVKLECKRLDIAKLMAFTWSRSRTSKISRKHCLNHRYITDSSNNHTQVHK